MHPAEGTTKNLRSLKPGEDDEVRKSLRPPSWEGFGSARMPAMFCVRKDEEITI
jgi:hypothetical protein